MDTPLPTPTPAPHPHSKLLFVISSVVAVGSIITAAYYGHAAYQERHKVAVVIQTSTPEITAAATPTPESTPSPTPSPTATATPTPAPVAVQTVASQINQDIDSVNLADIQSTLTDLQSSLSAFNQ